MSTSFNEIALVTVTAWNSQNADKNGNYPVLLKAIAGKTVNRSILAGTLAMSEGFELNKTYLVQISEKEYSAQYGRQFSFTNLGEQKGLDIIRSVKELGSPQIIDVTSQNEMGNNQQAQMQNDSVPEFTAHAGPKLVGNKNK